MKSNVVHLTVSPRLKLLDSQWYLLDNGKPPHAIEYSWGLDTVLEAFTPNLSLVHHRTGSYDMTDPSQLARFLNENSRVKGRLDFIVYDVVIGLCTAYPELIKGGIRRVKIGEDMSDPSSDCMFAIKLRAARAFDSVSDTLLSSAHPRGLIYKHLKSMHTTFTHEGSVSRWRLNVHEYFQSLVPNLWPAAYYVITDGNTFYLSESLSHVRPLTPRIAEYLLTRIGEFCHASGA